MTRTWSNWNILQAKAFSYKFNIFCAVLMVMYDLIQTMKYSFWNFRRILNRIIYLSVSKIFTMIREYTLLKTCTSVNVTVHKHKRECRHHMSEHLWLRIITMLCPWRRPRNLPGPRNIRLKYVKQCYCFFLI